MHFDEKNGMDGTQVHKEHASRDRQQRQLRWNTSVPPLRPVVRHLVSAKLILVAFPSPRCILGHFEPPPN